MTVEVLTGDCRDLLPTLPERSVQCCICSPPYFGLRRYLPVGHPDADREIGQEQTPTMFVEALVEVFRAVRRVLRDDGTLWVNIAPSYSGGGGASPTAPSVAHSKSGQRALQGSTTMYKGRAPADGYKPKDMIPTPWLLGLALQQDGWYLRAPIIWHKPNAMPSSVTDRPTLDYEYVLLLSKSERYHYDQQAIAEPAVQPLGTPALTGQQKQGVLRDLTASRLGTNQGPATRNARMVWSINTPMARLRPGLTPEQRQFAVMELMRRGLL
jgi:DNA modification methylase